MTISFEKITVLFVCMGNICRSPTGEGVFRHFVTEAGYSETIEIDSAGTIGYHSGHPADSRMQAAANKRGYSLDSRARQVKPADMENFDLVVAMDHDNLTDLQNLAGGPQNHIRLLGTFLDGSTGNHNARSVPDPYYGGGAGFEEVLDMIEQANPAMLDFCVDLMNNKSK